MRKIASSYRQSNHSRYAKGLRGRTSCTRRESRRRGSHVRLQRVGPDVASMCIKKAFGEAENWQEVKSIELRREVSRASTKCIAVASAHSLVPKFRCQFSIPKDVLWVTHFSL